jgi:N-acetylneuraminic acid mutarotase
VTLSSLPTGVSNAGATTAPCASALKRSCLYVVGGDVGSDALNTVYIYDPELQQWSSDAPLETGRTLMGVSSGPCVRSRKMTCIYAIGGFRAASYSGGYLRSVEMYNPSTDRWERVASVQISVAVLAATSGPCFGVKGHTCVYAIGGETPGGNVIDSFRMFNPQSNRWRLVGTLGSPREHSGATAGPCTHKVGRTCLYDFGGLKSPTSQAMNSAIRFLP